MTEADFQRTVIETAERLGYLCAHFHDSRRQVKPGVYVGDSAAAGFPDLVAVRPGTMGKPGRVVFAELKAPDGRLSGRQRLWLETLRRAGAEAYLWKPADFDDAVKVLKRPEQRVAA